jgi:hypothetical protein
MASAKRLARSRGGRGRVGTLLRASLTLEEAVCATCHGVNLPASRGLLPIVSVRFSRRPDLISFRPPITRSFFENKLSYRAYLSWGTLASTPFLYSKELARRARQGIPHLTHSRCASARVVTGSCPFAQDIKSALRSDAPLARRHSPLTPPWRRARGMPLRGIYFSASRVSTVCMYKQDRLAIEVFQAQTGHCL